MLVWVKKLNLIIPMNYKFNDNQASYRKVCNTLLKNNTIDEYAAKNCQKGQLEYLSQVIGGVYNDK